ncbi:MAG: phosphoribosylanthranilate isomerase [Candidatus Tantalella remota]|nr:phosphoribosylanthranilate isomerase [Candidatus Tantalella remota]
MVKVKICGLKSVEDAVLACESGADLLGFIFIEGTPRVLSVDEARDIIEGIPSDIAGGAGKVGLFKDMAAQEVFRTVKSCGLDHVQLQGDESPEYCLEIKNKADVKIIKAFKVRENILPVGGISPVGYEAADMFVFDTFHPDMDGGTGEKFDWEVLEAAKGGIEKPFFVAGGLSPDNVADAVRTVRPYGVDVSSGIEIETGKKDEDLLKEFIKNAKEA